MKRFIRNSVKEAFDNLPSGICFFDKNGILTLCNHQMYRVFFALTGKDLQSLAEMQELLSDDATAQSRQNQVFYKMTKPLGALLWKQSQHQIKRFIRKL